MYNRYINPGFFEDAVPPSEAKPYEEVFQSVNSCSPPESNGDKTKGKGLFGSSIKFPELNADTVLMLVLVYFLISDETSPSSEEDGENKPKNNITDTLLIIGALLLLGF